MDYRSGANDLVGRILPPRLTRGRNSILPHSGHLQQSSASPAEYGRRRSGTGLQRLNHNWHEKARGDNCGTI